MFRGEEAVAPTHPPSRASLHWLGVAWALMLTSCSGGYRDFLCCFFGISLIPGHSDVRIDIKSVGICGSDVHYYQHGARLLDLHPGPHRAPTTTATTTTCSVCNRGPIAFLDNSTYPVAWYMGHSIHS